MGAFDGCIPAYYTRNLSEGSGHKTSKPQSVYIKNQPAFSFFKGFGRYDLLTLLETAEQAGKETVWVPSQYENHSQIGLSTWYVRALLQQKEKE